MVKKLILLLCILILFILSACNGNIMGSPAPTPTREPASAPTPTVKPFDPENVTLEDLPTEIDLYSLKPIRLLSKLDENNLSVFWVEDTGSYILRYNDTLYSFNDWPSGAPQRIPPSMSFYDFDGDGRMEQAIVLSLGSGTGIAISELHVLEFSPDGSVTDIKLASEKYMDFLSGNISWTYDKGTKTMTVSSGGSGMDYSIAEYVDEGLEFEKLRDFGSIVGFSFNADGGIQGTFGIGVKFVGKWELSSPYVGYLCMDVAYAEGEFTFSNITFYKYC